MLREKIISIIIAKSIDSVLSGLEPESAKRELDRFIDYVEDYISDSPSAYDDHLQSVIDWARSVLSIPDYPDEVKK